MATKQTPTKRGRAPRSNNSPKESDEQTELELDLSSSGRSRASSSSDDLRSPKAKGGSEVAPTAKAELREKERHAREAAVGRVAAGLGGNPRDRRGPKATRKNLDQAARAADQRVAGKA